MAPSKTPNALPAAPSGPRLPQSLPIDDYLLEALATAKLARRHWQPRHGLPGLCELEPSLRPEIVPEMLDLVRRLQELQARLRTQPRREPPEDLGRARFLLRELGAALRFRFETSLADPRRQEWLTLEARSRQPRSRAALTERLNDRARLAKRLLSGTPGLPGLDPVLVPEALALAKRLLAAPALPPGRPASEDVPLRNELLA